MTTQPTRKKLLVSLTVVAFILILPAAVFGSQLKSSQHVPGQAPKPSQAISKACDLARFPELCVDSLMNFPGTLAASSDNNLLHVTVNMTLHHFNHALYSSSSLSFLDMPPRVRSAYDACIELLDDSVDALSRALSSVSGGQTKPQDVMTWLSSALTNHDTCAEGFDGVNDGGVKDQMTAALKNLSELVSNCLAIFAASSNGNDFDGVPIQNRRLLGVGGDENSKFPRWTKRREREILEMPVSQIQADIIVSKDGNGTCKTISEAIKKAPQYSPRRTIIYVKAGRYEENNLKVGRKKINLMFVGDGKGKTIISGGKSIFDNITTFHTATFAATGAGFIARDITFENYAGPAKHQAVALRVGADHAVIYRCGRHFVTLDRGKIVTAERAAEEDKNLEYQRICITTEDGGVVSLDFPADLDLREERGMDTTVILIPGTPEGSMDQSVRSFVSEALRRGVFPVVMNPRGCAGSPLTTPRLFTAADSDDISTAIRFLTKTRPWTTLMGVGRGYGANMLTKYLAEAGERTPLTAAVCIDNPFDLEEITRTSPYCTSLDQQLTGGLVEILLANKELFQGRAKAFDVGKALSSKSVRDFDKALSMVANGFESLEDFYASCATRDVIGEVKIPVLFIQNDDVVPLYSTPRSSIAENPFTSLLLCSSSPNLIDGCTVAVSWCQDLAIEWLTAVELGLLKGRHPLLKDVDVTVNPSKGLVLSEAKTPEKGITAQKLAQVARGKTVNGYYVDPSRKTLEDSYITPKSSLPFGTELEKNVKINTGSDEPVNGGVSTSGPVNVELVDDDKSDEEESERGDMLQTAEVVVNMLDLTMPGTLKAEEKKK